MVIALAGWQKACGYSVVKSTLLICYFRLTIMVKFCLTLLGVQHNGMYKT